jgi:predicted nucleic acid-binding protein
MQVRTLVDAGPLIGWLNADDQWHDWSVSVLSRVRGPLHTSEIILGEACWNLGGNSRPSHALLTLVRKGAIQLLRPWPEQLERTQELMIKYPQMDAGDASLVVLSEMFPLATVVTTDLADFSVYRRFRSKKIPAIFPDSE